jgi:hypothetical protein
MNNFQEYQKEKNMKQLGRNSLKYKEKEKLEQ